MPFAGIHMKVPVLLFLFCHVLLSSAQRYGVSMEAGYQFGIQTSNGNDAPFPSSTSYSLGTGISKQVMFHVFPDSSNWFFSTGLQHLSGVGVLTAADRNNHAGAHKAQMLTVGSLRMINRFSYRFQIRQIDLLVSAGFVLPLMNRLDEETFLRDSAGSSRTKARLGNYASIGMCGGLGLGTNLTKNIRLFCNADLILLNSKVKTRTVTAYSDDEGRSMDDVYSSTAASSFFYWKDVNGIRNNEAVLPAMFNKDKPTDKLTYSSSYSSIGLQMGFLFLF